MALLDGLTARAIEDLRSVPDNEDGTQIEARVHVLCSLMQQAATRLCPAAAAAATGAALSLLSGLQAARLRLPTSAPATAALERSTQHLLQGLQEGLAPPTPALLPLGAPAAAAAAAQPATDGGSRRAELASLVRGLGFNSHDWQAAQCELLQRTAAALGTAPPGSGTRASTAAGGAAAEAAIGGAALLEPPASAAPPDGLLQTAVHTPAWQPGSGEPTLLHSTVAELLWVLRQFPSPAVLPPEQQLQLSPQGWAAYWMLEPQALQQVLAEILQAAAQQPASGQQQAVGTKRQHPAGCGAPASSGSWQANLQPLLDSKPHWAAAAAAVAQHPALHLLARQTLHSWLAASGNPAAWRLLLHFVQAVRSSGDATQLLQRGQLPVHLRVLYPPGLAAAAAMLHMQPPSDAGLCEAVRLLQRFLAVKPSDGAGSAAAAESPAPAAAAATEHACGRAPTAWAAAAAERRQQVWQLQLDAPGWLLFCLRQLPLEQLLDLAAQQTGEAGGPGSRAAGPPTPPGAAGGSRSQQQQPALCGAASPAVARYVALALWHGEPLNQAVLQEALQLQLADVDLAAVRPWLQTLHGWQAILAVEERAEAADDGSGIAAAAAAVQHKPPAAERTAAAAAAAAAGDAEMEEDEVL